MEDETREYAVQPLSPVHIGSGETISPEEYLPHGESLIRFNPHAVLRALNATVRSNYEKLLDAGKLAEALQLMREAVGASMKNRNDRHLNSTALASETQHGESFRAL